LTPARVAASQIDSSALTSSRRVSPSGKISSTS
jgi:hypothetical protein